MSGEPERLVSSPGRQTVAYFAAEARGRTRRMMPSKTGRHRRGCVSTTRRSERNSRRKERTALGRGSAGVPRFARMRAGRSSASRGSRAAGLEGTEVLATGRVAIGNDDVDRRRPHSSRAGMPSGSQQVCAPQIETSRARRRPRGMRSNGSGMPPEEDSVADSSLFSIELNT